MDFASSLQFGDCLCSNSCLCTRVHIIRVFLHPFDAIVLTVVLEICKCSDAEITELNSLKFEWYLFFFHTAPFAFHTTGYVTQTVLQYLRHVTKENITAGVMWMKINGPMSTSGHIWSNKHTARNTFLFLFSVLCFATKWLQMVTNDLMNSLQKVSFSFFADLLPWPLQPPLPTSLCHLTLHHNFPQTVKSRAGMTCKQNMH